MQFLFNLFNHNPAGQMSLEDPLGIIGHQLQALGHKVVWEKKNDRFLMPEAGINLIIEGFTEASAQVINEAHFRGAQFICIATEEPTPKGFNHGRDREMANRQRDFHLVGKSLKGIFHLVPGEHVKNWFSQFAPTAYIELGHAPTLVRPGDWKEPEFAFGFFGSLTRRRLKILKRLAKSLPGVEKAVRVEATFPSQVDRDRIMREAKVIIQIRKYEEMGLVSSSRCNTALCLGRPIVAEPHLLSKPWDEVVKFSASTETVFNDALMARIAWRGVHSAQFARFREKFTPDFCVGRALREIGMEAWAGSAAA